MSQQSRGCSLDCEVWECQPFPATGFPCCGTTLPQASFCFHDAQATCVDILRSQEKQYHLLFSLYSGLWRSNPYHSRCVHIHSVLCVCVCVLHSVFNSPWPPPALCATSLWLQRLPSRVYTPPHTQAPGTAWKRCSHRHAWSWLCSLWLSRSLHSAGR